MHAIGYEKSKVWRSRNRETVNRWSLEWYHKNKDVVNRRRRERRVLNGISDSQRQRNKDYYAINKPSLIEKCMTWKRMNRTKVRNSNLRIKYGITLADYEVMLDRQNGLCAICQTKSQKNLSVDHDHKTGRVRMLLCPLCNRGLGMFGDSVVILRKAFDYLDKFKEMEA